MAKIPFDIKYRPQIESGEYKVETENGFPATILDWSFRKDSGSPYICVKITKGGEDNAFLYSEDGKKAFHRVKDNDLIVITPELAESEDERIRKRLVNFLQSPFIKENLTDEKVAPWLAWLEKQKEQKPTPVWMPKFLDELRSKKNYFDWDEHRDIEGHILAIINWIAPDYFDRKEKGQKSNVEKLREISTPADEDWFEIVNKWEKEDEQKYAIEEILAKAGLKPYKDGDKWCILIGDNIQEGLCGFGDTIDEALYQFLTNVLEHQKEKKPAECLKPEKDCWYVCVKDFYGGGKKQSSKGDLVQAKGGMYMMVKDDISEWFRKAYYDEIKPIAWSEDDEANWQNYIKQLVLQYSKGPNVALWEDINWLKYVNTYTTSSNLLLGSQRRADE